MRNYFGYPHHHALASADSRTTPNNSVFSDDAHADTWYALTFLLQQLLCSWKEQREKNGAHSTLLLQSYELPKHAKKALLKNEGNLIMASGTIRVRAPAPSTAARKYPWLQCKQPQIQARRTTFFLIFSDEVGLEGGHGSCCRFATLTGVYQGAHICLARKWINAKFRST